MSRKAVFICVACRHRRQIEVLSPEEALEAERRGIPLGSPRCEECGRPMIEER